MTAPAALSSSERWLLAPLLALALLSGACACNAHAQQWSLDGGGAMQIPSIEELSRPQAPRAYIPPASGREAGPLDPFLNDSTLRHGDVVVTPDGPMRFRGRDSFSHRTEDFAPVDQTAPPPGRLSR